MGSITKYIYNDVTIMKAVGTITHIEIVSVLQEFYTHNPTKLVIWDLVEASAELITSEYAKKISDFVLGYRGSRTGGKTAIVVSGDLDFGIGRMFEILGELKEADFEIEVFRNYSNAADWIGMKEFPIRLTEYAPLA